MLILLVGCTSAPIGAYPDDDNVRLPDDGEDETETDQEDETDTARTNVTQPTLTVTLTGAGKGTVTSTPAGLTCTGTTCTGRFAKGTTVKLTATPDSGALFGGWTGQCTGPGSCSPVLNADIAVTAEFTTLDGTWTGTYSNLRPNAGCNFNNTGNLTMSLTSGATAKSAVNMTGLEIRNLSNCNVVRVVNGASGPTDVTIAGDTMTGNWPVSVETVSGTLAFPFTAKITGNKITGSWTCPSCTGSFSLTKQ